MRHCTREACIAVLAGAVLALSACAPGASEESPTGDATGPVTIDESSFEGKTLDYVYFTDGPDEQATRDLIADFEAETGATVNLQILPFADIQPSLQARLTGDNVPDVARLANVYPFRGALLDLTRYFGEEYKEEFLPGPLSPALGPEGEMLAVPSDLTMNGPFVNVDQFAAAGVPVPTIEDPWTVQEMVAAAEEVQAANGTEFALAIDKSGHRVSTLLSQFGTTLLDDEGEALDPAAAQEALGLLTGLMESGSMSRDFWLESGSRYAGANEIFLAGAAPVYISGNWQVGQFAENATFEWSAVPNPCAERCGGFPGGKFMAAFDRSDTPDLAAFFVNWMNTAENQTLMAQQALFLPTREDLVEEGIDYPQRSEDMAVFINGISETPEDTYLALSHPAFDGAATVLIEEISGVVAGQGDVPTAVETIEAETAALAEETTP